MARLHPRSTSTVILFTTVLLFSNVFVDGKSDRFYRSLNPHSLRSKREKLSHLHFYFHDIRKGRNPTAIRVAEAPTTNTSATGFGDVVVTDDRLTERPEPTSKLVGRAQGIYSLSSQQYIGLSMVMNFAFMEGEFNGSTLSLVGRNVVASAVREMPIVGGSGVFRFARGYARARTFWSDGSVSGDAVVEYNIFVFHY